MRSRRTANEETAEVARRRLQLLSAELAAIRPDLAHPPSRVGRGGSGEPSGHHPHGADPVQEVGRRAGRHAARPVGRATSVCGWLEDRLPATLQGRVRIGASQLAALAVLVAAAMVLLAWSSVRAGDPGDLVPARSLTGGATSPTQALVTPGAVPVGAAASAPSAAASSADVVVDVTGKVRRPGIVRLPTGARVVDAVDAAGGARRGVDLSGLNLARVLVDGEQVVVGMRPVGGVAAPAASTPVAGAGPAAVLVNINTADQAELETLPGIGPVTAQAILQWRAEHGGFSAVDELMEVSGIGEATLADMAPFVTV